MQAFTRVFDQASAQDVVYEETTCPLFNRFLRGENAVMFAYGMTNAGKTYTIQGSNSNPGILPRLVTAVLDSMGTVSTQWDLHISMLEIYQENIYDLLSKKKKEKLTIRDANGKVEVNRLSTHSIKSTKEACKLMDTAAYNRSKSATFLNTGSSRSHAVYTITLDRSNEEGVFNESVSFQLVDLAGAERGNRTKATGAQQKEANNINMSLMQLWRCLQGMKKRVRPIIPFRESKLTHMLMPILNRAGMSGTAMIACVNPQSDDYDETLTILSNANIASKIKEIADVGRTAANHISSASTASNAA
ncbi:kinesin motor domain-containing protein, partial [Ochromonadaceae sp. CCMP2298]